MRLETKDKQILEHIISYCDEIRMAVHNSPSTMTGATPWFIHAT